MVRDTRQRLLNAYLNLKPWPDAADGLRKLRAAGVRIITISVFSGAMLRANAEHAGIADLFDELLSTEVNQTYKPDPRAYALGMERLHLKKDEIAFAAFAKPIEPSKPCSSPATAMKMIVASNLYLDMTHASSIETAVPEASSLAPGASFTPSVGLEGIES